MTTHPGVEKMKALARRQSLTKLADSLLLLRAKSKLDEAERLTHAVIMDVICEKCPAADAAFEAWAESDDTSYDVAVGLILAAVAATETKATA